MNDSEKMKYKEKVNLIESYLITKGQIHFFVTEGQIVKVLKRTKHLVLIYYWSCYCHDNRGSQNHSIKPHQQVFD